MDVFHSSMQHWNGDKSPVDSKTDQQNVENVTEALEWLGFTVQIVT